MLSPSSDDNVISYRMLAPNGRSMRVETSICKGNQCLICVARATGQPGQCVDYDGTGSSITTDVKEERLLGHDSTPDNGVGERSNAGSGDQAEDLHERVAVGWRKVRPQSMRPRG